MQLVRSRDDAKYTDDDEVLRGYVIQTSRTDLNAEEIWHIYVTLTRIFFHDSGLSTSQIHTYQLEQLSDRRSWGTICQLLQSHCYSTLILPAKDTTYRIRKAGNSNKISTKSSSSTGTICQYQKSESTNSIKPSKM